MTTSTTTTIAFRLPKSLAEQIETVAANVGLNQSQWVRNVVTQALHGSDSRPVPADGSTPATETQPRLLALDESGLPSDDLVRQAITVRIDALKDFDDVVGLIRRHCPDATDLPNLEAPEQLSTNELIDRGRQNLAWFKARTSDEYARREVERRNKALAIFERLSSLIQKHCRDSTLWPDLTISPELSEGAIIERCNRLSEWLKRFTDDLRSRLAKDDN